MIIKPLWARLAVAVLAPMALVTLTVAPIFISHLEERTDATRRSAEAMLDSEYDLLLSGMNESFNQVLSTAEYPLLRRFLSRQAASQESGWEGASQRDWEQLDTLFHTLLTHFGRYTRMAVVDAAGREWVVTSELPLQSRPPVVVHDANDTFHKAMILHSRDLYVSSPRLGASGEEESPVTPVIDIATPITDERGERLGVLMFTLDWSRLTRSLPHARGNQGQALLVDAQGQWLLPDGGDSDASFGQPLSTRWPAAWAAMVARNQGSITLDDHLLAFRSHDLRTQHYRSQAGMIISDSGTQPWHLGILMLRPSFWGLLSENPVQLLAIVLVYLLSMAFGVFWVLNNHRLRGLRQQALTFSREARQYAGEVQDLYEHAPCGYHSLDSEGRNLST
ncbi:cache domain-containing protein [Chromohalobacter israelensis]|uniref:cache domain-containing protein n=1 Tax=Chromohalobacter israelensis TaxID=141390 RepID=UPI000D8146BB|nr:PDC sensor domain-containing protein [Chromohalobacter salexigens]PWW31479.1 hypothetical protein DFO74_1502 [Chromohalobacter salexigens]